MSDKPIKVLVVDDLPENRMLLSKVLQQQGYRVGTAGSGREALDCYAREQPDVVLMDVMMPGMDGHETVRRLRTLSAERWIPIILVSAMSDSEDIVRGLEAGGDDYISKPVDLPLLLAKMRSMQRIASMQRRLATTAAELAQYRQRAEQEQEIAHSVMARMIASSTIAYPGLQIHLQPASKFNGDLLIANLYQGRHLYLLHADSMGHGLAAALPLLPLAQIFHHMTGQGQSVSAIATEINRQLHRLLPVERFVSAALLRVDRDNRLAEVWNGGNPAPLLVDDAGHVVTRFQSDHPPLGVVGPEEFDAGTRVVQWREPVRLVMYSDGVTDAENGAGDKFGEAGLLRTIAQGGDIHASLIAALQQHLASGGVQDDISLVVLRG